MEVNVIGLRVGHGTMIGRGEPDADHDQRNGDGY